MARFSVGARTSAGSTTLPVISLYSSATIGPSIREIGVTNTTATAVALSLCKLTSTGTQGTALTEAGLDSGAFTSSAQAFNTHTVTATIVQLGFNVTLGAAIGSGWIWTFGGDGLELPAGTGNGAGVIVATGTGQILDAYLVWTE